MNYEMPTQCPICQNALHVGRLQCKHCHSAIEGDFQPSRLSRLTATQQQFVISFLKCRGNIKDMEKEYAISYPTVRARIDEIVTALGEKSTTNRQELLERLARGEITAEEAYAQMDKEGK